MCTIIESSFTSVLLPVTQTHYVTSAMTILRRLELESLALALGAGSGVHQAHHLRTFRQHWLNACTVRLLEGLRFRCDT